MKRLECRERRPLIRYFLKISIIDNLVHGGPDRHGAAPHAGVLVMGLILLVVLLFIIVGALPRWPHSSNWGYYPSGGLGLVLIILIVLLLAGRI